MPRKTRTDRELSWLRSAWEELAQAELKHGGFIEITVKPTAMRARFYIKWEFRRPDTPGGLPQYFASSQVSYPTSEATDFLTWFWLKSGQFSDYLDNDDVALAPRLAVGK